jgi:hypothetical protein
MQMPETKMAPKVDPAAMIKVADTEFVSGSWKKAETLNAARLRGTSRWKQKLRLISGNPPGATWRIRSKTGAGWAILPLACRRTDCGAGRTAPGDAEAAAATLSTG